MFESNKAITILDVGYNQLGNICLTEDEFNLSTHKIYGEIERSNFKIKSNGTSNLRLEIPLNGVEIGDILEYELEYMTNSADVRMFITTLTNYKAGANAQYGFKPLLIKNSNDRWNRLKGYIPIISGALISKANDGVALILGFDKDKVGYINIRNFNLKVKSKNEVKMYQYKETMIYSEEFFNNYLKNYMFKDTMANKLSATFGNNLINNKVSWDTSTSSFKMIKSQGDYNGNYISHKLDFPEINGSSLNKFIIVKLNYKLLNIGGNGAEIFYNFSQNISQRGGVINIPQSTDFVTKYFIIPLTDVYHKQSSLNILVGFENKTTDFGELYIKEFSVFDSIITNTVVLSRFKEELLIKREIFAGDNIKGTLFGIDGLLSNWNTIDVDLSTLTNSGNGFYSTIINVPMLTAFGVLFPFSYVANIVDTGLPNAMITCWLSSFNATGCNVRVISSVNTGTIKLKVQGIGRWK